MDRKLPARLDWTERGLARRSPLGALRRHVALSAAQQQSLIRRLRRSNTSATERQQIRARLVSGTFQVVLHCLHRIGRHRRFAELVQEAVLALAHAVDVFARRDRHDFARFAAMRITKRLRRILRAWAREPLVLVGDSIDALSDGRDADPFSAASQTELGERLESMMSRLPEMEQRVLRLRFGLGTREAQSREAIGKELLLDQQRVRYLEERALSTLRRRAAREHQDRLGVGDLDA